MNEGSFKYTPSSDFVETGQKSFMPDFHEKDFDHNSNTGEGGFISFLVNKSMCAICYPLEDLVEGSTARRQGSHTLLSLCTQSITTVKELNEVTQF